MKRGPSNRSIASGIGSLHLIGRKEVYLKEILAQAPRIIGLQCRVPSMKPYGCFDRPYWNYGDYGTPRARRQEGVLTLALLYTIEHEDNVYYRNRMILEWIKAGIDFWMGIQLRTGAFNEAYPNEFNHTSTAFTSYAVSESLLLLKEELPARQAYLEALRRAAEWLRRHDTPLVVNQNTGAAVFLYNMHMLTGDDTYAKLANDKFEHIASSQDPEGWFNEYGGPDIGYLSLGIGYLAKYFQKSGNERVLPVLARAVDFISYFVHPNDTYGGEYASRDTEYLMPDGFEILAPRIETANAIAETIADAIRRRSAVLPFSLDDKYLLYNGYDYLQAYLNNRFDSADTDVLPYSKPFFRYFKSSRIAVRNSDKIYVVAQRQQGRGSFRVLQGFGHILRRFRRAGVFEKSYADELSHEQNERRRGGRKLDQGRRKAGQAVRQQDDRAEISGVEALPADVRILRGGEPGGQGVPEKGADHQIEIEPLPLRAGDRLYGGFDVGHGQGRAFREPGENQNRAQARHHLRRKRPVLQERGAGRPAVRARSERRR